MGQEEKRQENRMRHKVALRRKEMRQNNKQKEKRPDENKTNKMRWNKKRWVKKLHKMMWAQMRLRQQNKTKKRQQ